MNNTSDQHEKHGRDIITKRGQQPRSTPAVRWLALMLSILLLALAGIAIRELWLRSNGTGMSWLDPVLQTTADGFNTNRTPPWRLIAGSIATGVGFICLMLACKPRRRTHRQLDAQISLWLRPIDIARMASAAARQVPEVCLARSTARRHSVRVVIESESTGDDLTERVENAVRDAVAVLAQPPKVKVRTLKARRPRD